MNNINDNDYNDNYYNDNDLDVNSLVASPKEGSGFQIRTVIHEEFITAFDKLLKNKIDVSCGFKFYFSFGNSNRSDHTMIYGRIMGNLVELQCPSRTHGTRLP